MPIHSEDRQILIRGRDGVLFPAAVTHREKKGAHLIVVTTTEEHLPRLRDNAPAILELVARQHSVSFDRLRYFERGREGAVFEVNTSNVALSAARSAATSATSSAPQRLRRGVWCDETNLKKRLGKVRLPEINPALNLAQAVQGPGQKAAKPAVRAQRPRLPQPH